MLFWILVTILAIGIACMITYETTNVGNWVAHISIAGISIGIMGVGLSLFILGMNYFGLEGRIAVDNERYETLAYQYENDIYDNDNDLGKRELMVDIQDWNEDLARGRAIQDDFWIGIYVPNIFDQFEFIELE